MASTDNRDEVRQRLGSLRQGQEHLPWETPHGTVYPLRSFALQIPMLLGAFAGGPLVAWLIGKLLGNLSENAEIFLYVSFALVFFLGYGFWAARLASLAVNLFGRHVFWTLLGFLFRRPKPEDLRKLIPDRDKLTAFLVAAQRAAWSFLIAGILVGIVAGMLSTLIDSDSSRILQMFLVFLGAVLWGYLLGWLGRRGYLPLPQPGE